MLSEILTRMKKSYWIMVNNGKQLGMSTIPAIILSHLDGNERRAYRLADNAIARSKANGRTAVVGTSHMSPMW